MVYVFNCSEQMDYKSCGNIYKGLAQTGAWGCFDEFNRISVEVLSVVAVQVKSVQDAIRDKKDLFNFMGEMIAMVPTVGIFITVRICHCINRRIKPIEFLKIDESWIRGSN